MKRNNKYEIKETASIVEIETDEGTMYASQIETEYPTPPIYLHPTPVTAEDRAGNLWVAQAVIDEGESRLVPDPQLLPHSDGYVETLEQDADTTVIDVMGDVRWEIEEALGVDADTATTMRNTAFQDYFDTVMYNNRPIEEGVWAHFFDTVSEEFAKFAVGDNGETTPIANRYTPEQFDQLLADTSDEVINSVIRCAVEEVFILTRAQVIAEEIEMEVNAAMVDTQQFFDNNETPTTKQLENVLDNIWKIGDQDECSIKHVWGGIAALVVGQPAWVNKETLVKNWDNYVSAGHPRDFFKGENVYPTPWDEPGSWTKPSTQNIEQAKNQGGDGEPNKYTGEIFIPWHKVFLNKQEGLLEANWGKVQQLLDEVGHERFGALVAASKFNGPHIELYLTDFTANGYGDAEKTTEFLDGLETGGVGAV